MFAKHFASSLLADGKIGQLFLSNSKILFLWIGHHPTLSGWLIGEIVVGVFLPVGSRNFVTENFPVGP